MKQKKMLTILMLMVLMLTGCETNLAYTFNIETGEQVKVQLDTTNGQKLKQEDGRFMVNTEEDEAMSIGVFFLPEVFNELYDGVSEMDGVTILEENKESEPAYIFYQVDTDGSMEWNYLVKIKDAEVGVVVSNVTSQESAQTVMELLTFEVNPD